MKTIELKINLAAKGHYNTEIIIALLNDIGYSGFFEQNDFLLAYIPEYEFNYDFTKKELSAYLDAKALAEICWEVLPSINGNAKWEESFSPL